MTEIFSKLRAKLLTDAGSDIAKQRIAGFMAWLLEKYNHDDIASEIVSEKKKKSPTLKGAYDHVTAEAKKLAVGGCACIEDKDVYWSVVRYLNLEDCTDPDDVEAYCSDGLHANAETEKATKPAKSSPFSVDIDSLFD